MANDPHERVALITGAGSGMGAACVQRFAVDHAGIVLADLRQEAAESVAAGIGAPDVATIAVACEVSDPDSVRGAVDATIARFGRLDVLVNAAGIIAPTPLLQVSSDEWRRIIDVNLSGSFFVTQAAARVMRDRGWGRIVLFSSTAGKTVSTLGGIHYTASKHGVLGVTRAAAKELATFGITVNAVCPGLIDTEMARALTTADERHAYAAGFPIARLGRPEEVADLVHFLASDAAAYLTGAAIDINGGDLLV